ncbi:hypothetical protein FLA_3698 [Filimonas lacunae]|nr:hypothetical protein FLA_3698 [Filimonas lacunae]
MAVAAWAISHKMYAPSSEDTVLLSVQVSIVGKGTNEVR